MTFGIASLVFVGLTWTLAGVVMGSAPKHGVDPARVLFCSGAISILASFGALGFFPSPAAPAGTLLPARGVLLLAGAVNGCMLLVMSHAMRSGPNGIVWNLIQSSLVLPFLTGVLFFGERFSTLRIAGVALTAGALLLPVFDGGSMRGADAKGKWKAAAFLGFLLAGAVQIMNSLPSYDRNADALSSVDRTLCFALGSFLFMVCRLRFARGKNAGSASFLTGFRNMRIWGYALTLQFFGILSSWFLLYPGMNALAEHGSGALSYPLMVGACMVGFNVYSIGVLREKWTPAQTASAILSFAGIAALCV